MMKVRIVGASGKLGRYMVRHALERGYEVVGVCRAQSMAKLAEFGDWIRVVPGPTNDPEVIRESVLDQSPPGARLVYSCGWHISRDGKAVHPWKLKAFAAFFDRLFPSAHEPARVTLAAGLAFVLLLAWAPTAPAQDTATLEAQLQALLDEAVANGSTPGIMMRVEAPGSGLSFSGVAGVADLATGAPLTRDNPVRIASNTKTFLAVATLRLWEDGRLGLDDPLSQHLSPEHAEVLTADGYDLDAMTIRHLLTHTSGLYDYADRDLFVQTILDDPHHRWTPEEQLGLAVEWGDPYGAPGEVYRYSDTGYVVLGLVLESVYGAPLAVVLRELVGFERLGMDDTWLETLEDPPAGASDRAHQYMGERDTWDWDPSLDLYGGGGLVSTADDMAMFMRALFSGGVYRDAATADTMLTTVEGAGQGPDLSGMPMVPGRYRMGVEVRERDGLALYMHTGFWGTLAAYMPGPDVAISIAVTQQQSRALFRVFAGALELLAAEWIGAPAGG